MTDPAVLGGPSILGVPAPRRGQGPLCCSSLGVRDSYSLCSHPVQTPLAASTLPAGPQILKEAGVTGAGKEEAPIQAEGLGTLSSQGSALVRKG